MHHVIVLSKETGEMFSKDLNIPVITKKFMKIKGVTVGIMQMKQYELRIFHSKRDRDRFIESIDIKE